MFWMWLLPNEEPDDKVRADPPLFETAEDGFRVGIGTPFSKADDLMQSGYILTPVTIVPVGRDATRELAAYKKALASQIEYHNAADIMQPIDTYGLRACREIQDRVKRLLAKV